MGKRDVEQFLLAEMLGKLYAAIATKIDEISARDLKAAVDGASWPCVDEEKKLRDYESLSIGGKAVPIWSSDFAAEQLLNALGFERACDLLVNMAIPLEVRYVYEGEWKRTYDIIMRGFGG